MTDSVHHRIQARIDGAGTGWIDVDAGIGFEGSWQNLGSGNQDAEYERTAGWVELRGAMSTGTSNTTAFTLPAGFRPPKTVGFAVSASGDLALVTVSSAGVVTPIDRGSSAVATNVRLDGVRFSVLP